MYNVHGCVIVHNMYEFQHSSSRADCTFWCKIRGSNAEESTSANSKRSSFRVSKATIAAHVPLPPGPQKQKHLLSLSSSRQVRRSVSLRDVSHCLLLLLYSLLLHCPCFAHCCHDPIIVRTASTQTFPPFLGFTQFVHPSRSSLTTVCFCFCFRFCCLRVCIGVL